MFRGLGCTVLGLAAGASAAAAWHTTLAHWLRLIGAATIARAAGATRAEENAWRIELRTDTAWREAVSIFH